MKSRYVFWPLYVLLLAYFDSTWSFAETLIEANEVKVTGQRSELSRIKRGGSTVVLTPRSSSANDLSLFFASEPSVSGFDTGFYSFRIPLFRGQDSKSTSLLVNGVKLVDPLTSMPLLDDLDLRMFDRVTIHKGLTPWDVPGSDSGGVLDFEFETKNSHRVSNELNSSKQDLGIEVGSERLTRYWGRSDVSSTAGRQVFFGSRKAWKGDFEYLDDQGTILNSEDDEVRRMNANSGQSNQFAGYLSHQNEGTSFEGFVASFLGESGYPDVATRDEKGQRHHSETALFFLKSQTDVGLNLQLGTAFSGVSTNRRVVEQLPNTPFLENLRTSELRKGSIFAKARFDSVKFLTQLTKSSSEFSYQSGQGNIQMTPKSDEALAGFLFDLDELNFEAKVDFVWDQKVVLKNNRGLAVSYTNEDALVWSQFIVEDRKPSLLESYGDGGSIESSFELKNESHLGAEMGFRLDNNDPKASHSFVFFPKMSHQFVMWNHRKTSPIEILQVSRSKWKALNLNHTKIIGTEFRGIYDWSQFELEVASSQVRSLDSREKLSPRLPIWQGVLSPKFHFFDRNDRNSNINNLVLSSTIRHLGPQFADEGNSIQLLPTTTVDLTIDWDYLVARHSTGLKGAPCKGSLSVINATNVVSQKFVIEEGLRASGTVTRFGRSSSPLPGRQWIFRFETRL